MNKYLTLSTLACVLFCAGLHADVVELKNGNVLNGTFLGGTATTISFEAYGNAMQLAKSDIVSLTFNSPAPAAAPAPASAPAAAAPAAMPAAAKSVTLPVGTLLLVRMMDGVSSQNDAGTKFTTKLEYDLIAEGVIAVKAGTIIYGTVKSSTQAKRARGTSTLDIRLTEMVPHGTPITIASSGYQVAGENSINKVAKAAAVGAVIGNNTGSGDGAGGAAWGAAAGALKPGQTLTVAPGELIEFKLENPVTIPAGA